MLKDTDFKIIYNIHAKQENIKIILNQRPSA